MNKKTRQELINSGNIHIINIMDIINSGFAGINKQGTIVDRRTDNNAVPIQKNKMFTAPEPKKVRLFKDLTKEDAVLIAGAYVGFEIKKPAFFKTSNICIIDEESRFEIEIDTKRTRISATCEDDDREVVVLGYFEEARKKAYELGYLFE